MEDKKRPSRGFQKVEHFFLSGSSKVDRESKTADAITGKNVDVDHSDSLAAAEPVMLNETEKYRINPAKLDSLQYPPEGYSVESSLGVYRLPDGDKTRYPPKGVIDILSNSPHTPQISTPQRGINSDFENPLQEGTLFSTPLRGINAAKQIPLRCSDVSDRGSKHRQANDCIGSTVAKLEVLKRSCQGVALQAERTSDNSAWFQGAAAIIQEAISTLSEVINPAGNNNS
jgi:hypothetical protein